MILCIEDIHILLLSECVASNTGKKVILVQNYGTLELWFIYRKTMVLWQKSDTIPKTMELRFTKEKHSRLPKEKRMKLWFLMNKLL